ncbi:TIGR03618 family F420-dependent PPOX class oxidoreductase [Ktedonosporobacter rubrisoli]|uniref:TIGR03618 family F420-dependent PPOX class oxidoreductase n=1 Tax=Ktedonosporobacter rubrisoli TaxID=2509675 RepID=A0A4P6JZG4_KTERU|nr:TIGR03618 family F420-dependent PPOX class oxidoreductase [Ktedonosporobacter rubrisoli]QBD81288.1 TIGR03618 family F420-dependent PPOX class oxidoreductase [Ktedonosporobacter rubrisoli]
MIPQDMYDLLRQRNPAIVGVDRPSGSPHLSPVWFLWGDDSFYFRIDKSTAKYRHLKRNPAISLLINDHTGFRFLTVYGQAQIMEDNPADIAAQIVHKYYAPALAPERMPPEEEPDVVTIKLRPEKVVAIVEEIAREAANSWS